MKKRAVVICPGRGTYTKETLGYLRQYGDHVRDFAADLDHKRRERDEPTVSALDQAEVFKPQIHTRGEHASSLIYACAYADFMAINRDKYDIVAVTGNSMGWYLTLAMGASLDRDGAFQVINTMGGMMKEGVIGGQVIYPVCDENWQRSQEKETAVELVVSQIREREGYEVYPSIFLGGYIVLGGNRQALSALLKELPPVENYPFQLINHAAFHTPLLRETSERAFALLGEELFFKPKIPLIDGRGFIWQPYSTKTDELRHYTLGTQVVEPYDFSTAVAVALKEFIPDALILLGPGSSLGGAIGQILVQNDWWGLKSKGHFQEMQSKDPFVLAMGRPEQRELVV